MSGHAHVYHPATPGEVADAVGQARVLAHATGRSLTRQREAVYSLLLTAGRPLGAYELMAKLGEAEAKTVAPPTVYRALDFLQELGLVARIESSNEFLPCAHPGQPHDCMFLVCACCGVATEIDGAPLLDAIEASAERAGFTAERHVVEIRGRCSACSADAN